HLAEGAPVNVRHLAQCAGAYKTLRFLEGPDEAVVEAHLVDASPPDGKLGQSTTLCREECERFFDKEMDVPLQGVLRTFEMSGGWGGDNQRVRAGCIDHLLVAREGLDRGVLVQDRDDVA